MAWVGGLDLWLKDRPTPSYFGQEVSRQGGASQTVLSEGFGYDGALVTRRFGERVVGRHHAWTPHHLEQGWGPRL
jgi:hypothetical protein